MFRSVRDGVGDVCVNQAMVVERGKALRWRTVNDGKLQLDKGKKSAPVGRLRQERTLSLTFLVPHSHLSPRISSQIRQFVTKPFHVFSFSFPHSLTLTFHSSSLSLSLSSFWFMEKISYCGFSVSFVGQLLKALQNLVICVEAVG